MEEKRKYRGYLVKRHIEHNGTVQEERIFVGETYATSKAKAINNVRFRQKGKARNSNSYYGYGDSGIMELYDAELVG